MIMKKKEPKIPVRVLRLVDACKRGQRVCLTYRRSDVGDEKVYSLDPSGRPAGPATVERALELGLIAPVGDGLFPEAASQTYEAVQ